MRERRTGVRLVVVGTVSLMTLAGCGSGDGSTAVKAAEARVSAKEKDLAAAKADLADASKAFCASSATYITALDRYGDLLSQTAPTVGDVTDAGAELEQPRTAVTTQAESAVAAQEAVVQAKQDLADAEAALAEAKHSGSPAPSTPTGTGSPKPLAPPASVNRVQQAEAELTSVRRGITDQTPLTQASQQFNAAAVALEMSWLRLFSDAGCLTDAQQVQAEEAVGAYTADLQTALRDAGYYDGPVDGVYGPATVDAVETLQKAHGLPVTGALDKASAQALQRDLAAKGGAVAQEAVASTAAVQQTLKLAGFWDGPVDGSWTPALTEALKKFQTALGVQPTGTVDAATITALEKAIADAQASPSAVASSPTPSSTALPSSPATGS